LILVCLFEAMMSHAKHWIWIDWLDEQKLAPIVRNIPAVAIGGWRWMESRFFAGGGSVMWVTDSFEFDGRKGCPVHIGASTEHALQSLRPYLDDSWTYNAL
jgi:hypothetical protein